jgi:hypothetical protein
VLIPLLSAAALSLVATPDTTALRPISEYGKGLTQAQIDSGAARYLRENGIVVR